MTTEQQAFLHKFFKTLYTPSDSIGFCKLTEPGPGIAENQTLTRKELLSSLTPEALQRHSKDSWGLFFTPNPLKDGQSRSGKNVKCLNTLFVDIDTKEIDPDNIEPEPHFIFSRGPGKYHLYYLIERIEPTEENLKKFKEAEENLIASLGGDRAVKDPARLLRVPYSHHLKTEDKTIYYEPIKSPEDKLIRYDINDFLDDNGETENTPENTDKLENLSGTQSKVEILSFLKDSYRAKGKILAGAGRSLELFFVGLDCYGFGFQEPEAVELARWFNENINSPTESESVLQHQIKSAYQYYRGDFGEYLDNLNEAESVKAKQKLLKQYKMFQKIRSTLKDYVYVAGAERLIHLTKKIEMTTGKQVIDYIHYMCRTTTGFSLILAKHLLRMVDKLDFRPEIQKRIYEIDGVSYFNKFKPLTIQKVEIKSKEALEKIKIFTDHLEYLTTSEVEYNSLLNYFAYVVQNIGEKLPYAVLLISQNQGIGKSILEKLFKNFFPGYVGSIENTQLTKQWTDFMSDRVLVFVHELAQGEKYSVANRFKNYITEDTIEIEGKYARTYATKNTVNFIMFSNESDAIKVTKQDRRFFVVYNKKQPKPQEYYTKLVDLFDSDYETIYSFLYGYDLTGFNPYARPKMTEGKRQLIDQSTSELNIFLQEMVLEKISPFNRDLILVKDVQTVCESIGPGQVRNRASIKMITKFIQDNGFESVHVQRTINGVDISKSFWSLKTLDEIPEDTIIQNMVDTLLLDVAENKPGGF